MHDLVIRNGTIVDGTGTPCFLGDVAISGGVVSEVGDVSEGGKDELEARGQLVTPGFVDIHTHYDGQVTWEERLVPSSSHGVTTVLMGNCGVGFAPCRADDRQRLVRLMEGVEDIPGVVMTEGLPWNWETFPEYLDAIEGHRRDINIAAQLPHSCLRVYVMGERAINREEANSSDLQAFTNLTEQAMRAGALGLGTSRSIAHRDINGVPIPTKNAAEIELHAIAAGIRSAGRGVLQVLFDLEDLERDFGMLCRIARRWKVPISFTLAQTLQCPDVWEDVLIMLDHANREGLPIKAQVIGRPTGVLLGLELSYNPFSLHPTYAALSVLPLAERLAALRRPDVRRRILSEKPEGSHYFLLGFLNRFDWMFVLGNPPNYEPPLSTSVAALAEKRGVRPEEIAYDLLLADDGCAVLFVIFANYVAGNLDTALKFLKDNNTILGLGDGGAHYGIVCDAGYPTFMLSYWARDRVGEKLAVEQVVQALTREPAAAVGLHDRGVIAPGYRADLNIIDYGRLRLHAPTVSLDLPGGGRRLQQSATGYTATIVNGVVTYRNGTATGALPGRLIRGAQAV